MISTARGTALIDADRSPLTLSCAAVRAVTFQAPGEVRVEERPDPEPAAADDAVVRVEATGICGSDLHIYHGRVAIEPGFVIGHEYVGTVVAAGDAVSDVAVGDRVLGTYCTACGRCFHCRRGGVPPVRLGPGLRPRRNARLPAGRAGRAPPRAQRQPDPSPSPRGALGRGGAVRRRRRRAPPTTRSAATRPSRSRSSRGRRSRCSASGRWGCARSRWRRRPGRRWSSRSTPLRSGCGWPRRFGAVPVHLTEDDPRGRVKELTGGRGVDLSVDAVGHPEALDLACRLARKAGAVSVIGVYAERAEVHMGVVWIKALQLAHRPGQRHRPPGSGAGDAVGRRARSRPARHPPDDASTRPPRRTRSTTAARR